jgi:hypothetical protein
VSVRWQAVEISGIFKDGKDRVRLIQEVHALLVWGTFLIVEPMVVVSAAEFQKTLAMATLAGFRKVGSPLIFLSRTALFRKDE